MRRRPTPRQLELFARPDDPDLVPTPHWRMLPEDARVKLTELMIRLILDHAAEPRARRRTEARHES